MDIKITIEINTDNAAFGEPGEDLEWEHEVRRIVNVAAEWIGGHIHRINPNAEPGTGYEHSILDYNGSRVGQITMSK